MTSDDFKQIAAALGATGGLASTIVGYFVMKARNASAAELKKIDVSSEWQSQMLSRISGIEAELQRERARGDMLESQLFAARAEAHELQWKFAREQSERQELSEHVRHLGDENAKLRKQNEVLSLELRELHNQIISGHSALADLSPKLPRKA